MTKKQIVNYQTLARIEKLFQQAMEKRNKLDGDDIPSLTEWVTENLKLKPKHGGLEDFVPNQYQLDLFKKFENYLALRKPIRLVILKSRQLGVSTAVEALLFYLTYFYPLTTALVIAHRRDSARQLFLMVKRFYTHLPVWRKKSLQGGRPHRDDLEYAAPHSSQYHVLTAGSEEVGRGWTLQFVHASEVAFYVDPETSLTALSQAIPKPSETSFSAFILESTANGQNLFKDYWELSQDPASDWEGVFYSWKDDRDCIIPIGTKEFFVLDKEEIAFQVEHGLTLQQMRWARQIREDQCQGSWGKFLQEYPVSPSVAFVSTGYPIFRQTVLEQLIDESKDNPAVFNGTIEFLASDQPHPLLVEQKHGPLSIWEQPRQECDYIMGVDTAEGIGSDYSEAIVMRRQEPMVVAQFRSNRVPPMEFAVRVWLLGAYYWFPLLGCESNTVGGVVLAVLEHGHGDKDKFPNLTRYPRLYYDVRSNVKTPSESQRLGFLTSARTKGPMISRLGELIADNGLKIYSIPLLSQLKGFTWEPEGKKFVQQQKDGLSGLYHDDGIVATAICNEMRLTIFQNRFIPQAQRSSWS